MAYFGTTEVVPRAGSKFQIESYVAGVAIVAGDIVVMQSDGKVDPGASGVLDTTNDGQGIVGVAVHRADAENDAVSVILLSSADLILPALTTAPTLALLGVVQTTLYTLNLNSSVWKVDLGTTANGLVRFINMIWADSRPLTNSPFGPRIKLTGWAAEDRVKVRVDQTKLFTL